MAKKMKEFALTKAIMAVAYDMETNEVLASTKNIKGMTVTDETGIEYLVGGENNTKLIPIVGEQDAKISFTTATTSDDWLALQLNAETVNGEVEIDTEATITVEDDGTIELKDMVSVSTIYTTDDLADGRDDEKLVKMTEVPAHYEMGVVGDLVVVADGTMADDTTEVEEATVKVDIPTIQVGDYVKLVSAVEVGEGQFTITEDNKIKVITDLAGKDLHIFYVKKMVEGQSMKSDGGQGKTVKLVVTGIAVDPSTQIPYIRTYTAYKAKVTQSVTQEVQNSGVPNDITLEFACLRSNKHKCSYETRVATRQEVEAIQ